MQSKIKEKQTNQAVSHKINKKTNQNLGWRVSKVKEDMKCGEIPYKTAVCTIPRINSMIMMVMVM